ncbi:hypothetical protein MKZ38_010068 [Zalerion maritima]|uniref:Uncharacterized protein n=1 Tax=Zalerion maritima TaxID=339359 RepID=A0AAD5RTU1_9PEZI|nr:hypothetical protein MKZ38_010068 [Zalerion maritima]
MASKNTTTKTAGDSITTSRATSALPTTAVLNPLADLGLTSTKTKINDDTASVSNSDMASSVSSRGRRRRRNRNKGGGAANALTSGMKAPAVLPRIQESKPVRLQLGLNLDVDLELKAHIEGDVSLSLLAEKKYKPRKSPELKVAEDGTAMDKEELFHMRLGRLKLRQKWIDREISSSLTLSVMIGLVVLGFISGFLTAKMGDLIPIPFIS